MLTFTLLILLWRGYTNNAQSCVIFFGGLATGMAQSAIFVGLTAGIERENIAVAASGLYLSSNFGTVAGASGAGAIFQYSLRRRLNRLLSKETDGAEVRLPDIHKTRAFTDHRADHKQSPLRCGLSQVLAWSSSRCGRAGVCVQYTADFPCGSGACRYSFDYWIGLEADEDTTLI